MDLDTTGIGVDLGYFEGQSYGDESQTTTTSSVKIADKFVDGIKPIELPQGFCCCIFSYG